MVGYEQNCFRLKPLIDLICEVIPEFSFGIYEGDSTLNTVMVSRVREAARAIYSTEKYKSRGEFGELILHLLLRDFCNTIPLISKIYFKDATDMPVHGFDGVHITEETGKRKLWLGESKLYLDGVSGVSALAKDLESHLKRDYLRNEFALIRHKLPHNRPDIEYWRNLIDEHRNLDEILDSICIPMVCTYSCRIFNDHREVSLAFVDAFITECRMINEKFKSKKIKTDVEVILMLLPVPDKNELVTGLDNQLCALRME